ncbi:MAG: oligosaccharide flippase family protein [Agathobacter sp.]|nr:oligosaccharide flippase family protein [Agathobacter sp.]
MSNTRTANSVKNIFASFANQIIMLLLGFISRSVFIRFLSVDYLGIQGLFSDILTMLSLADLGFGTAMTFSMYKPLAEKDYKKLAGLTTFYKKVYRVIALAITVIGLALVPFLKYLVKLDTELPHLTIYYLLYLANTIASYLVVYKTCILNADQKGYVITKYTSIFSVLQSVTMIIFLVLTRNYIVYLCVQVAFTYFRNFYISYVAEKMYPFIKEKVVLDKSETNGIFKNIGSVFLYKISSVLINATDNTLISVIVGTATVGYLSNYNMIITKITSFVNTLFYSLTASLGNLIVKEKEEKRYEIFLIMQSLSVFLSSFCIICVYFLMQDLIKVWLGEAYQLDKLVLIALVVNFYFSISLLPIWVFREATGLYQKTKFVMLFTAGINIILSIILGKWIGLAGILFATSIARILTYFWYEPRLLFRTYFGKSCIVYFLGVAKSLVVTALIFAVIYVISGFIVVDSWLALILKAMVVGAVTLVLLILIYYKSEGTKLLLNKVKGFLKR